MEDYILGDPRFRNIRHSKKGTSIFAWTKKERNLVRAKEAGVYVPEPIICREEYTRNKFMGENESHTHSLKIYALKKKWQKRFLTQL
ncbi:MAG: RIO1 family regulatory kinase/ATPase [Methanolobus sp.]